MGIQKKINLIYKAIIYRIWSILITSILVYILTHNIIITTTITIVIELAKLVNYYIFENLWSWFKKNDRKDIKNI